MNSFLAASIIRFLAEQLGQRHGALPRDTIVKSTSAVDLRPYLNRMVPTEQVIHLTGMAAQYHPVAEPDDIWHFATAYHAALRRSIELREPVQFFRALAHRTEGADPAAFAAAHQTLVPYAILSNLGRLDWPDAFGEHRLEKAGVSTPMSRNWRNDTGLGIVVCTAARKLSVHVHYLAGAYTTEEGFALARRFASRLIEE